MRQEEQMQREHKKQMEKSARDALREAQKE